MAPEPENHNERTQRPDAAADVPHGADQSASERRNTEVMLARRRSVRRQAVRTRRSATQGW